MAIKLDCSSQEWSKLKIEGEVTGLDHPIIVALRSQIWAVHQVLPITWIKISTDPTIIFEAKFVDDRKWQETRVDTSPDPGTEFLIDGVWKPSEFVNIRSLRETITTLLNLGVTDLDIRPR